MMMTNVMATRTMTPEMMGPIIHTMLTAMTWRITIIMPCFAEFKDVIV